MKGEKGIEKKVTEEKCDQPWIGNEVSHRKKMVWKDK